MNKLNYETKTVNIIDYNTLDNFVRNELGWKDYNFCCIQESPNDTCHSFNLNGKLDEWALREIRDWGKGSRVDNNHTVLNYLVAEGHIPAGECIVEVCW